MAPISAFLICLWSKRRSLLILSMTLEITTAVLLEEILISVIRSVNGSPDTHRSILMDELMRSIVLS